MILIDWMNHVAELGAPQLVRSLWQSTLVALLVLGAVRLGRRWPAPLRYALLVVALLKFAMPATLASPFAVLGRFAAEPMMQTTSVYKTPKPRAEAVAPQQVEGGDAAVAMQPRLPAPARTHLTWPAWMLGAYLLGLLGSLAWIALQQARLRRLASRCTPALDRTLLAEVGDLCQRLGLRRRPRLLLSARDHVPVAFGVFHPTVVLPQRLVRELPPADVRVVLAHELAHHRRGDLWLNWLQIVLSAVWWFDPFYWLLSRQLRSVREDCCDDLVLARGLSSGDTYCETLLRAARIATDRVPLGAALAYGMGAHPMRRRLIRVMQARFRPAPALAPHHWMLVVGLGLVLLPGATTRAARSQPKGEPAAMADRLRQPTPHEIDIEVWRRDLKSSDPERRAEAASQLGQHGAIDAIPDLVALLADAAPIAKAPRWNGARDWSPALESWMQPSPGEAAAIALASMSLAAAMPLIEALGSTDAVARRNAAWALGELHNPREVGLPEVPQLVRRLRDPEEHVRAAAAWALGETKDRRATLPLVATLHDRDPEVRRQAAHALGELADPSSTDPLLEALKDSNPRVRETSSWALREIQDRVQDTARRLGY